MKKFISFVMAAAMVASLVPATAFAKGDVSATAKVVDALNLTKTDASGKVINETTTATQKDKVPELQLTITSANYRTTDTGTDPELEVTVTLDNAEFVQRDSATRPVDEANPEDINIWNKFVDFSFAKRDGDAVFSANPNGTVLKKDGESDVKVSRFEDIKNWDAVIWLMTDLATPKTITATAASMTADDGGDTVKITKTVDGVTDEIEVYDKTNDAWKTGYAANTTALVEKLKAGYTFKTAANAGAFKVTDISGGDVIFNAVDDTVVVTADDQITDLTTNAGWTRGDYMNTAGSADVVLDRVKNVSEDQVTFVFSGKFAKDDVIIIDLFSKLNKTGEGRNATVSVDSSAIDANDLVYVSVKGRGITATTRKVGSIAEEEMINLETDLKISSTVGNFVDDQWFEMKLSKGFEFSEFKNTNSPAIRSMDIDGNAAYFQFVEDAPDNDTFTIDADDIEIESTSAKSGSTCTITVKALDKVWDGSKLDGAGPTGSFTASTTVEVLKVVDYKVILSVDEDEDVPVIYSGVNVDNYGITDDSDHMSLEVTAKESFPGAWSMRKGFNFELPEHVYVTDVKVVDTDNFYRAGKVDSGSDNVEIKDVRAAFWNAYQDGKHVNFEFAKRVFDDVDSGLRDKECAEMTFQLELVADPGFEGDVVLKLTGELVDEQEVTIAKFVKPYEVKAEQNDMKIDYRYTEIPTTITLTEAEKGLWAKNEATFYFYIEKEITFDSDPTFEIDSKSDLEIKDDKTSGGRIQFTIKSESDEAATVTIKDMDLFMKRDIPAGPYDLKIDSTLAQRYEGQVLFAPDQKGEAKQDANGDSIVPDEEIGYTAIPNEESHDDDECSNKHGAAVKADSYVGCVADYSATVKEAFVNVITAGREVDDASFTTKVVVPVGESYIVAGEKQIDLDTPAYINAAGYTMLPIRAVAVALGINSNNVLWDQPTKTVTILYGQRIITMTQGQKVVYVNGSAIPASAAVENTNSRTFLPMRDLATALGVTDITWDQATRTATLNGNQK